MSEEEKFESPEKRKPAPNLEPDVPIDDAVIGTALKWSLATLVVVLCIGGGIVAYFDRPLPPLPETEQKKIVTRLRNAPTSALPEIPFTDVTRQAHLTFVHENGATKDKLLPETMGGGCAFFDYNSDGFPDILFVNSDFWPGRRPADQPQPTMALYQNDGHGDFKDVTKEVGLDVSFYGQGVAVGDFDNDGWVDIFFSAVGPDKLFRNIDGKKFEDVTDSAGVAGADREWGTSCGWFDFDRDGDLDLFVCNYVRWSPEIDRKLGCTLVGGKVRAYCRPDAFEGTFPYLYRNDGEGKFTDVSAQAGLHVKNPDTGVPVAKSLGVVPIDVDGDGWLDLIVANDTVQNFLFHNRQNGTFEEIGKSKGIAFNSNGISRGAMGIDAGYPRNDDTLAVVIGNFSNEPTAYYCGQRGAIDDLLFTDDAVSNGIGPSSLIWLKFGVFLGDLDLDGRLDILVANGHIENDIQKVQSSQQYAQAPQLFWNAGTASSTEFVVLPKEKTGPDFTVPLVGRGAAFADIDGDGDLDVLLTATGGAPRLLRNDQTLKHHWLRLKLVSKYSNRDAIGAVIEVVAGGKTQRQQVMPTRSYLSQVELPVTFGLGNQTAIDRVTIYWPDGSKQDVPEAAPDQLLTIEQTPP